MHLACSSVFCGGGTNQELAHHCLYECKGDIMVSAESRTARPTDKAAVCATDRRGERLSHWFSNTAPRLASLKISIDTFRCKVLRLRKLIDFFFTCGLLLAEIQPTAAAFFRRCQSNLMGSHPHASDGQLKPASGCQMLRM